MRTIAFIALMATLPSVVFGHQLTGSSAETARLGSKVISSGDSGRKVRDAGGEPLHTKKLTDEYGNALGTRLIYKTGQNKHTVIYLDTSDIVVRARDVVGSIGKLED